MGLMFQQATDAYVAHLVQEVLGPIAHIDQGEWKCVCCAHLSVVLVQEGELASDHREGRRCALHQQGIGLVVECHDWNQHGVLTEA